MGKDSGCGARFLARARLLLFVIFKTDKIMIDRITEEKIKDAAKIVDVVGEFLDLKKKGVEYTTYCPFHQDKHLGNFMVSPKRNMAKCFSCGWAGDPIKFLMEYGTGMTYKEALMWLAKKYSIPCEDAKDYAYRPAPPRPPIPQLPTLELPKFVMAGTLLSEALANDNLVTWIRTGIRWDAVQRCRINEMISCYCVGHSKNGHTIFWQIDHEGKLRTGKMMKYKLDGHRDKEDAWNFDFIHAILSRKRNESDPWPYPQLFNPDKQEMRQCLYGMHLLNRWKRRDIDQTVCIVESEKTALLMAIAYGSHVKQIWMACGGLENLNREKLKPLIDQGRRIILYPDRDGIEKWLAQAEQLHYDRMTIDTRPVTEWWKPQDGEKADIADVVIRNINESKPFKTINDVAREMPEAKELIKKMKLEIDNEQQPEPT